mgnify:CR=1 FL=1
MKPIKLSAEILARNPGLATGKAPGARESAVKPQRPPGGTYDAPLCDSQFLKGKRPAPTLKRL